ncbi:MAG: mannonate dehydratase [Pedobacter sp.]|nr:MAG: mannonate dehydratase [Pedobacter sp.]
MKKLIFSLCSILLFVAIHSNAQTYLKQQSTVKQLYVKDKPFLILAGELGNSSSSNTEYMSKIWPKLKSMNLNTVLAPVYWELIEPEEGEFNFDLVDDLIKDAKKNEMKLIFLWFGAWKNSMSCYAPYWVKKDQKRFPRATDKNGVGQEILSPFYENNLNADIKVFSALMKHIKAVDKDQTVLMIQVENEIGMLPEARDYNPAATEVFKKPIPTAFINHLKKNKDSLMPEFKANWAKNGFKTTGNWEDVFGKSLATDEIFMAWFYAEFINKLADVGKKEYNLPMYLNAALNYKKEAKPGEYPSAGPLPHLMDVWKAGAPNIDLLSPDFYNPDFKYWNDLYVRGGNTLFIPEIRFEQGMAGKALYAIGHHSAMGFSPFSIENGSKEETAEVTATYKLLEELTPLILQNQGKGTMNGVLFDKVNNKLEIKMGDYILTFAHDLNLGWSGKAKDEIWPITGALVVQLSPDEFIIAGTGVVVTFKPIAANSIAGIGYIDEGVFTNGVFKTGLRFSGDQSHQGRHLRIPEGNFSTQKIKLYTYK